MRYDIYDHDDSLDDDYGDMDDQQVVGPSASREQEDRRICRLLGIKYEELFKKQAAGGGNSHG